MARKLGIGIVLGLILAGTAAWAGGPETQGTHSPGRSPRRFGPVGGWHPDAGGLCRWWNPDCYTFPRTPDDYCRKPLPRPHCPPRPVGTAHAHGHPQSCPCPTCARAR